MYVSENFFDLYNSETTNITIAIAQYEKILQSYSILPIITSKYSFKKYSSSKFLFSNQFLLS